MVAEEQSSPMPDKEDPWTEEVDGDERGGWPAEYVEGDQNEPGSQAPPGGDAVPDEVEGDVQRQAGKE
jgi:hypothetical protein